MLPEALKGQKLIAQDNVLGKQVNGLQALKGLYATARFALSGLVNLINCHQRRCLWLLNFALSGLFGTSLQKLILSVAHKSSSYTYRKSSECLEITSV